MTKNKADETTTHIIMKQKENPNYSNKNNLVKLEKKSDVNGVIKDDGAKFDATYYGEKPDTGIPNEATGLVRYNEAESGVDMNIAFGVK